MDSSTPNPAAALAITESFLRRLSNAFGIKDIASIESLFLPNGYLRDVLICRWDWAAVAKDGLKEFFSQNDIPSITNVKLSSTKSPPVWNGKTKMIVVFFTFETPIAFGEGVIRLQQDFSTSSNTPVWNALTLSFILFELKGHPELAGKHRPKGVSHGPVRAARNWLDERLESAEFRGTSTSPMPTVLIVGAGHSGLMVAACLKRLGIRALIIEKEKRLGDSWRKRYHTLVLHDQIHSNHFPYVPFPDDWPVFIPKDKLANWFETYASIMEIDAWTEASVVPDSTSYSDETGLWTYRIHRADGSIREMTSKHIIQATGHSGEPNIPKFPGAEKFKGKLVHSSQHTGAEGWEGKKAVVVGACNSAHDIAHEFYSYGADVTMVQRTSTLVVSSEHGVPMLSEPAYSEGGPPREESDLARISFPFPSLEPYLVEGHRAINAADKDLLEGLERAGFKLDGKDTGGLFVKYWSQGGGYYIDVGCSQLIIDGKVKIYQGRGVASFEENGVKFTDGSFLEADIVVLATGYKSMRETCRKIFGTKVADRTGEVWGFDEGGDMKGIWRPSGHPGFWYMGGSFLAARTNSKVLALQIQAVEVGLAPKDRLLYQPKL